MTADERAVREKWPDAELSEAFATQPDRSRKWMYCVMSTLKFIADRRKRNRVCNVGTWQFTKQAAWADAAQRLQSQLGELKKGMR